MQNTILVDKEMIAYADVEEGRVFCINSVLVDNTDESLAEVMELVGDRKPTHDYVEDNPMYLYGKARLRSWRL